MRPTVLLENGKSLIFSNFSRILRSPATPIHSLISSMSVNKLPLFPRICATATAVEFGFAKEF